MTESQMAAPAAPPQTMSAPATTPQSMSAPGTSVPAAAVAGMCHPPLEPFTAPAPVERPYFIPDSIDYASLPEPIRRALVGIVGPVYEELVERAVTPLERTTGNTFVFLIALEVVHQFDVAQAGGFLPPASPDAIAGRFKLIEEHVRLVTAKQHSARFVLRVDALRGEPYSPTLRRLPSL